jgi:hypothetical protein
MSVWTYCCLIRVGYMFKTPPHFIFIFSEKLGSWSFIHSHRAFFCCLGAASDQNSKWMVLVENVQKESKRLRVFFLDMGGCSDIRGRKS